MRQNDLSGNNPTGGNRFEQMRMPEVGRLGSDSKQMWKPELHEVPGAVVIRQVPSGECSNSLNAEEVLLNFSSTMWTAY